MKFFFVRCVRSAYLFVRVVSFVRLQDENSLDSQQERSRRTVYVQHLAPVIDNDDLRAKFEIYGTVRQRVICWGIVWSG